MEVNRGAKTFALGGMKKREQKYNLLTPRVK